MGGSQTIYRLVREISMKLIELRIPAMAVHHSGSSRSSIPDDAGLGVTRS